MVRPLCSVDCIYFPVLMNDFQPGGYLPKMVHAVIVFFYLSYLNVHFNYVFAFFCGGRCNEVRTDSGFVRSLWVSLWTLAERTGKRYLSYQELLFFCQAFLFVRSLEGLSFSVWSAGSISFSLNIKELMLLVRPTPPPSCILSMYFYCLL